MLRREPKKEKNASVERDASISKMKESL